MATSATVRFGFAWEATQHDPCDRRWNLFHHVLTGDLLVEVGAVDLSARFGWVPLLNVAVQFEGIERRLADEHGFASLEFTESEDRLDFTRRDRRIRISATYVDTAAEVPADRMRSELRRFRSWAAEEARRRHPCLARRPEFASQFEDCG